METILIPYSRKTEGGRTEKGEAAVFISGRQCAILRLHANPPDQSENNAQGAVCKYLRRENTHALVFYELQVYRVFSGVRRFLLPSARRCYFHFDPDGTTLRLVEAKSRVLRQDASLVQAVMAYLYRTELAVLLDRVVRENCLLKM